MRANVVPYSVLVSGDVVLDMPEIGISITLAELYEGVEFDASDAAAEPTG